MLQQDKINGEQQKQIDELNKSLVSIKKQLHEL